MQRHAPRSSGATIQKFSRARTLAISLAALLIGVTLYASNVRAQTPPASTLPSTGTVAVATYESVGLYWQSPGGSTGCEVKYRKAGDTAWAPGLAMWYDARDAQCRGSLVSLAPNTYYQVEFNLPGQAANRGLVFKTWANQMPVARTVTVASGSNTFNVAESGTAAGYVVYDGKGATLDAANGKTNNVTINASYVIVRGLTLKGAIQDAIRISPDVHDVIIEDNDISGWGRTRDGTWATDMDSGIRAYCNTPTLPRVTIQRNKIHDPRYSANSWSDGHPAGPQAVTISHCAGQLVIRHNEMYSTNGKYFNDVIGGEDNFTKGGFPNADSDIYGNRISHGWDDGIEAEGANENVRIWGNYIDRTAIGIATTVTSIGPAYIFRNVWNRAQMYAKVSSLDLDDRQPFFKSGSDASLGNGRRYVLHNTMLQATQSGLTNGLGGGFGMGGTGAAQLVNNTFSKNNVFHLWKPGKGAFYQTGTGNEFAADLYNGTSGSATEVGGISGTPVYVSGHGWTSEANGNYQLAAGSPGFGKAVKVANFNDGIATPDVGAHQSGSTAMKFGLAGSAGSAIGGGTTTPPPTTPPPAPPTTPVALNASATSLDFGNAAVSRTVSFTNNTTAAVRFSRVTATSTRFRVTSACSTLAVGASCVVTVAYTPSGTGSSMGTLTVTSNAPNRPSVALTNPTVATPPPTTPPASGGVTMSATSLIFTATTATQKVTYTNNSPAKVTFIQATMSSAKFGQTNNCGEVAVGASCSATITYSTRNTGSLTGTFTMTSTASNSAHVVSLTAR